MIEQEDTYEKKTDKKRTNLQELGFLLQGLYMNVINCESTSGLEISIARYN